MSTGVNREHLCPLSSMIASASSTGRAWQEMRQWYHNLLGKCPVQSARGLMGQWTSQCRQLGTVLGLRATLTFLVRPLSPIATVSPEGYNGEEALAQALVRGFTVKKTALACHPGQVWPGWLSQEPVEGAMRARLLCLPRGVGAHAERG